MAQFSLSTNAGYAGGAVSYFGSGWLDSSVWPLQMSIGQNLNVDPGPGMVWGGTSLGQAYTDSAGNMSGSFAIPNFSPGTYTVYAWQGTIIHGNWRLATAQISVQAPYVPPPPTPPPPTPPPPLQPTISISPTNVSPGGSFTISGSGFTPNGPLWIYGAGTSLGISPYQLPVTLCASPCAGNFPFPLSPGANSISVLDGATGIMSNAVAVTFNAPPPPPPPTPPPPTMKTVSASAMVTGGFPDPDVQLQLVVDGVVQDTVSVSAVPPSQVVTRQWSVATGHNVHVHLHLSNPVGVFDLDSGSVAT